VWVSWRLLFFPLEAQLDQDSVREAARPWLPLLLAREAFPSVCEVASLVSWAWRHLLPHKLSSPRFLCYGPSTAEWGWGLFLLMECSRWQPISGGGGPFSAEAINSWFMLWKRWAWWLYLSLFGGFELRASRLQGRHSTTWDFLFSFETEFHGVAQIGLELEILPQPLKYWNHRCGPLHPASILELGSVDAPLGEITSTSIVKITGANTPHATSWHLPDLTTHSTEPHYVTNTYQSTTTKSWVTLVSWPHLFHPAWHL
jgi:hypothetical protein